MCENRYWCVYCGRELIGDAVYDGDEVVGFVFVHDDIEHPVDTTYDEEMNPQ